MTKRRTSKAATAVPKPERRSRGEIDRNYFLGDVLIKTGVAVVIALAVVAFYTPFSLEDAVRDRMIQYLVVVGVFAALGIACFIGGRHLRHEATHWDFD
jgi:uncharacterized membrane protein